MSIDIGDKSPLDEGLGELHRQADPSPGMTAGPSVPDDAVSRRAPRASALVKALVVGVDVAERQSLAGQMGERGYHVTTADGFAEGRERLMTQPPALLITALRLREYNGLQLVLLGKSLRPGMAALVVSPGPDAVLRADADALGATFLEQPVADRDLAAAVTRTVAAARRPPAAPIRPPFDRRQGERRTSAAGWSVDRRRNDRRAPLAAPHVDSGQA